MVSGTKSDACALQRLRLQQVVQDIEPNWAIQFLPEGARIRFRITEATSGQTLAFYSGAWKASEIDVRSDQELRALVFLALTGMIF